MPEYDELANTNDYENRTHEKEQILEGIKQVILELNGCLEGNATLSMLIKH